LPRHSSTPVQDLIRACAEGNDGEAWEEFISRFGRPISLSVLRVAGQWGKVPGQIVADLVQDTYFKLCADKCCHLLDFAQRQPEAILGYIKKVAISVAHDHFKSLHTQKRGAGETDQWLDGAEAQAEGAKHGGQESMEQEILFREVGRILENCAAGPYCERDCTIFWLCYDQGMTAREIASLPAIGLTEKGVEAVLFRRTREVREHLAARRLPPEEPPPDPKGFRPE